MSRIGRMPITIPSGVQVTAEGQQVTVKGPKGELDLTVTEPITVGVAAFPHRIAISLKERNRFIVMGENIFGAIIHH